MSKRYQVHEFAALAGLTCKTLRHYDRLGLLRPRRTATGYRVYSVTDLYRLEQIVALKFLGLPLKQIKCLLDRRAPLSEALLGQRTVLQEKKQQLDRAICAIRDVEAVIASGKRPDTAILRRLIEVIAMQNHQQSMKQYYSDDAWEKLTRLRQQYSDTQRSGISESWLKLFREAESLLGEDPASENAQELCVRWAQLWQNTTGGDADIVAGHTKAWADRDNWPAPTQQLAKFNLKKIGDFISKAFAASMKKYYSDEAWARKAALDRPEVTQAWKALNREVEAALDQDPASEKGRDLARRWCELTKRTTQDNPAIHEGMKRAWKDRGNWPPPLQQHVSASNLPKIVDWIGKAIREHRENVS